MLINVIGRLPPYVYNAFCLGNNIVLTFTCPFRLLPVGGIRIAQKTTAEPRARIPRIRSTFSVLTVSFVPCLAFLARRPGLKRFSSVRARRRDFSRRPYVQCGRVPQQLSTSYSYDGEKKPIDRRKGRRSRPEIERYSLEINI